MTAGIKHRSSFKEQYSGRRKDPTEILSGTDETDDDITESETDSGSSLPSVRELLFRRSKKDRIDHKHVEGH